jgi:hypothetical protein
MKKSLFLFALLGFLFSCSTDHTDEPSNDLTAESLVVERHDFDRASVELSKVERQTLSEINQFFAEHGLEPISEKKIIEVRQLREDYLNSNPSNNLKTASGPTCYTAEFYGDWSRQLNRTFCNYQNVSVSSRDIVLARQYINAFGSFGSAPSGNVWNGYRACTSENFGVISFLNCGTGLNTVDLTDIALVVNYILGLC